MNDEELRRIRAAVESLEAHIKTWGNAVIGFIGAYVIISVFKTIVGY